jgi:hypothetical protein
LDRYPQAVVPALYFLARVAQINPAALRGYEILFDRVLHKGRLFILGIMRLAGDRKTRDFLDSRLHSWKFMRERREIRQVLEFGFPVAIDVTRQPVRTATDMDVLWAEFTVTGNTQPVVCIIDVLEWPDRIRQRLNTWLQSDHAEQPGWEETRMKLRGAGIFLDSTKKEVINKTDLDWLYMNAYLDGGHEGLEYFKRCLPFSLTPQDVSHIGINGAARWSLTANSEQHPAVLATCQEQLVSRTGHAKTVLIGICARMVSARTNHA